MKSKIDTLDEKNTRLTSISIPKTDLVQELYGVHFGLPWLKETVGREGEREGGGERERKRERDR